MLRFGVRLLTVPSCVDGTTLPEDAGEAAGVAVAAACGATGSVALALGAVVLAVAVGDAVAGAVGVGLVDTKVCESAGAAFCTTASALGWRGGIVSY